MPLLSVLLPVRDALPWLPAAAASLARQTVADHEVIAVDDDSRDGSAEWLDRHARSDPRWRVLHPGRVGLPGALNRALAASRAPFLARHDADDLSHRRRFERQLARLAAEPETGVVGTRVRLFPHAEVGAGMRRWEAWHNSLLTHESMAREVLIDSPLAHGSAVFRRESLERVGGWHERGWAEDLDLWVRMLEADVRFSKCTEPLYGWRQHQMSSTRLDSRYSHAAFRALKVEALDRGLLAGGRRALLLGSGGSLERWREALGPRLRGTRTLSEGARTPPGPADAPLILVLLSPVARQKWRIRLSSAGFSELRDFIFVA